MTADAYVAYPGEKIVYYIQLPPDIISGNEVHATVYDSGWTQVADYTLSCDTNTGVCFTEATAPENPGVYHVHFKVLDSQGNLVLDAGVEPLVVDTDQALYVSKEVLDWVKYRVA